jgi:SAM-dependent methyltransferase
MKPTSSEAPSCLLCKGSSLSMVPRNLDLKGVTSDCRSWRKSFPIFVCQDCGHVQKLADNDWLAEVERIYNSYEIYHLSSGEEQQVFLGSTKKKRSVVLLEHVKEFITFPRKGRLLDVGCGNGALLRTFAELFPAWTLVGADLNENFREEVVNIPGVEEFCVEGLNEVKGRFDLITCVHVLEHIHHPLSTLRQIRPKLADNGILILQVPDLSQNPYDISVVDHCSHFVSETLAHLSVCSGFQITNAAVSWLPKEISLIMRRSDQGPLHCSMRYDPSVILAHVKKATSNLEKIVGHAGQVAAQGNFGIFGTAISGTWLAADLGDLVDFFIDEDPIRQGKRHMQRLVLSPDDAPSGAAVYLSLSRATANKVKNRLAPLHPSLDFVLPPEYGPEIVFETASCDAGQACS